MLAVTVDDVMSWELLCDGYTRERVTALFAGRKTIAALDVLDMDIPLHERLCAVLREAMLPVHFLHEFACRIAETVLMQENKPDPRGLAAIEAKRKWLWGEISDKELRAAQKATRGIARPAARNAAWNAAQESAQEAAWDTAWCAARDRVWEALFERARKTIRDEVIWKAVWEAAWVAVWEEHCTVLRGMLEEARRSGTGDAK